MNVKESIKIQKRWVIRRYADQGAYKRGEAYDVSRFDGNVLLNEGIQLLEDLLIGAGGTVYNNANARLGVGDSNTAESASQTGLQAATNKTYKAMESGYPSRTSQTVTWRAVFGADDANYNWREFTVVNAADDTGANLNRKVSDQGTKAQGQVWTLDLEITIS